MSLKSLHIRFFLPILAVMLVLSSGSCSRRPLEPEVPVATDGKASVCFCLKDAGTRSTSPVDDARVRDWKVFLCTDGAVAYSAASYSGEISLEVTKGIEYTVYALVNAGASSWNFGLESEILSTRIPLELCSENALVMFGSIVTTVSDNQTVSIPVRRVVSKVILDKVTTDFSARPELAAKDFVIESVYMINVAGEYDLQGDVVPEVWYNRSAYSSSLVDPLVYDSVGSPLSSGASYAVSHRFYVCPNPVVSDVRGGAWSPRHTRLVLQALLGGRRYYYSVSLPQLERNCYYRIAELVLTGRGSLDPDEESGDAVRVSISRSLAWDGDITVEEES